MCSCFIHTHLLAKDTNVKELITHPGIMTDQ